MTPPLLAEDEPPPYSVVNPGGKAPCLLICEHASNAIPKKLDNLGLTEEQLRHHAILDIGVDHVTRCLSEILDAPAIIANYSRAVIDINRRLDHPTVFLTENDGLTVTANLNLGDAEKQIRIDEIYEPFHQKIRDMIEGFRQQDMIPAIVSIHSYSPLFYKQVRPWHMGILWTQDPRMPVPVIEYFREKGYTVGDNEPYDARVLRGTTINQHADDNRLPNVLVEIRNDQIDSAQGGTQWAEMLGDCLKNILQDESIHSYYDGPEIPYDPEYAERYFEQLKEKAKRGEL